MIIFISVTKEMALFSLNYKLVFFKFVFAIRHTEKSHHYKTHLF